MTVNRTHTLKTEEPFVVASQVEQVYYVQEPKDPNWLIVQKAPPRDLYNIPIAISDTDDLVDDGEIYRQDEYDESGRTQRSLDDTCKITTLQRNDIVGETIPSEIVKEIEEIMNTTGPNEEFIDDDDDDCIVDSDLDDGSDDDIDIYSYFPDD
ncbi:hypothetical protein REPUB_Repub03eG0117000 [Reevesia pubescens]